jgi:DNA-binding protein
MSGELNSKIIVVGSADVSAKISDVTERIISCIMDDGAVDVVGVGDAMFLACSAINLSCEIAKIYINQISIGNLEDTHLGKTAAIFTQLAQQESTDFERLVAEEEKAMDNIGDRTVSVGHEIPMEKLVTRSLMALARFDEIKLIAAGGSINEAVSIALRLTAGQISKGPVGVKLIYVYSINMRNDPAKRISAISIYLKKGITTEVADFVKKLKSELPA